ncbi:MAG: response regulator transcription factor [Rhodothermales bacterium]
MSTWDVIMADDHAILLDGLAALVDRQEDLQVIGTASNGTEALALLERHPRTHLLITDHSMPGMSGLELVKTVRKRYPDTRIIVLTMHDELHLYLEMEKVGVDGYVLKKDSQIELLEAIQAIRNLSGYISPALRPVIRKAASEPDGTQTLSRREKEILGLIVKEYTNQQIAETLFISEFTVETHRKNIFRKTGANSLVGLVNFAHANGLIPSVD